MKILSSGGTDPGKKRTNNEDAYLVTTSWDYTLWPTASGQRGRRGREPNCRGNACRGDAGPARDKDRTPRLRSAPSMYVSLPHSGKPSRLPTEHPR